MCQQLQVHHGNVALMFNSIHYVHKYIQHEARFSIVDALIAIFRSIFYAFLLRKSISLGGKCIQEIKMKWLATLEQKKRAEV